MSRGVHCFCIASSSTGQFHCLFDYHSIIARQRRQHLSSLQMEAFERSLGLLAKCQMPNGNSSNCLVTILKRATKINFDVQWCSQSDDTDSVVANLTVSFFWFGFTILCLSVSLLNRPLLFFFFCSLFSSIVLHYWLVCLRLSVVCCRANICLPCRCRLGGSRREIVNELCVYVCVNVLTCCRKYEFVNVCMCVYFKLRHFLQWLACRSTLSPLVAASDQQLANSSHIVSVSSGNAKTNSKIVHVSHFHRRHCSKPHQKGKFFLHNKELWAVLSHSVFSA